MGCSFLEYSLQLKILSTQSRRGNAEINNRQQNFLFLLWQNIKHKYLMSADPIKD